MSIDGVSNSNRLLVNNENQDSNKVNEKSKSKLTSIFKKNVSSNDELAVSNNSDKFYRRWELIDGKFILK